MRQPVRQQAGVLAAALWWGSLTALGFVVVPLLFMHLGSPAAAGAMAAKLFSAQTWLSTGCALLMLMVFRQKDALAQANHAQAAIKFIVAGMLLALLVEFGVAPRIVSARAEGGNLRLWHGLGSAMYFGQWLCAGFTLWRLTARSGR
ncbi:MAG: putative transrane protein [Polaromonas sp.]|nr:putative transrane protein [Polaromonas sp.]